MPQHYNDIANAEDLSLAAILERVRRKRDMQRAAQAQRNPGTAPVDAQGLPASVWLPGEAPVQAQPVSGPPTGLGVRMGEPIVQMDPMRIPVGRAPQQATSQQPNPQAAMDPRAARLRALLGQGLSFEQAMRRIQAGG
jgi:hypothetical protein